MINILAATWKRLLLIEIVTSLLAGIPAAALVFLIWQGKVELLQVVNFGTVIVFNAAGAVAAAAGLLVLQAFVRNEPAVPALAAIRGSLRFPGRLMRLWMWWVLAALPWTLLSAVTFATGSRVAFEIISPLRVVAHYLSFILLLLPMAVFLEGRGPVRAFKLAHRSWPTAGLLAGWLLIGMGVDELLDWLSAGPGLEAVSLTVSTVVPIAQEVLGACVLYVIYLRVLALDAPPQVPAEDAEVALGG